MTYRARLFIILLAFQFISANVISLESPIIPQIDCNDLNNNGNPDFIAFNNSITPQILYHVEYKNSQIEILWEYLLPEESNGYFSNMILGDFDDNGVFELIVSSYQDGREETFYIFSINDAHIISDTPEILALENSSISITNPRNLYQMNSELGGPNQFIVTQGSPNRAVIICEYINKKIKKIGSLGDEFINAYKGPIDIALGNFDNDRVEDVFILCNGLEPEGQFIFSDGSTKNINLSNYSSFRQLYPKGLDLNFDEIDDILMINKKNQLLSNVWEEEFIFPSTNEIQNILANIENGLIYISITSQAGYINTYTIDPITKNILAKENNKSKFLDQNFSRTFSIMGQNYVISSHNGKNLELWFHEIKNKTITENTIIFSSQKIYSEDSDYVINIGDSFIYPINIDSIKTFLNFKEEKLPQGMIFNLKNMSLEWTPELTQLGFHDFSYILDFREKGEIEKEIENDKQIVRQMENILEEKIEKLIYVNDYVKLYNEQDTLVVVNKEYFEWFIPIDDKNMDAVFNIGEFKGAESAQAILLKESSEKKLLDSTKIDLEEDSYQKNNHKIKFFWTPNTKATEVPFSITISDGYTVDSLSFLIIVHPEIDLSMNITEYIVTVNETITIPVELQQSPPSSSYSFNLIDAPENMWITEDGIINWVPLTTQVDNYLFQVEVSDGIATSILQYNIYVNAIPIISTRPSDTFYINKGDSLFFPLESFDMNSDAVMQWRLISGPDNMSLTTDGILHWNDGKLNYHDYKIGLSDGIDSVYWEGMIYVNASPQFESKPITFISEDAVYNYPIQVMDENLLHSKDRNKENAIELILAQGPEGMSIKDNILLWEDKKKLPGSYPVVLIASDGIIDTPQRFQLLVNSSPIIISDDSISVRVGDILKFNVQATDSNLGDSIFYSIKTNSFGLDIDKNSGLIVWVPENIGQHYFTINANDKYKTSNITQELQIFVYEPPSFLSDTTTEAFIGLEYSSFFIAEDMFGDRLKELGSIIIENTTINNYTLSDYGLYFRWIPDKEDIGEHQMELLLTDKYGFTSQNTITISVFKNPCYQCATNPVRKVLSDSTSIKINTD